MTNDLLASLRSIDAAARQVRDRGSRDARFAKLQATFVSGEVIGVTAVASGIRSERGHLLQAPFRLLPLYDSAADICIINSNAALDAEWGRRLVELRGAAPKCLFVAWLMDHHHVYREMLHMCESPSEKMLNPRNRL